KQVEIVEKYIDSVLQTKKPLKNIEIEIDNEHKENLIRCLVDVLPLFDSYQKLNGAFLQFRDMSEFYKLQEQVIASEKLSTLGILGTGFAHEIKNPLTAIIGLIQLLQNPDIDLNTQEKYLNIISKELERIKDLTNQFASLGK
ncbi:histidine kinase dimerization/phospho-acceptor domain-containing protein, partial [Bacillus cereus]